MFMDMNIMFVRMLWLLAEYTLLSQIHIGVILTLYKYHERVVWSWWLQVLMGCVFLLHYGIKLSKSTVKSLI